jgi:hypothetical protein
MVEVKKGKMKAVRWEGKAFSISAKDVDTPKIVGPLDAIVRLTSAAICGSDLHTYRGRLPMNHPLTFGHENLGIVEEVGEHVTTLKKGDRVLVGAGIAEVTDNGELGQGLPGEPTSYGTGDYEPGAPVLDGGQAQFMRVSFANANLLVLPPGNEHELDYLLLADIWPQLGTLLNVQDRYWEIQLSFLEWVGSIPLAFMLLLTDYQVRSAYSAPTQQFFVEPSESTVSTRFPKDWQKLKASAPFP